MKLYIKLNYHRLFRHLQELLPKSRSDLLPKLKALQNSANAIDYQANVESGEILSQQSEQLFYKQAPIKQSVTGIYYGNDTCEHLVPSSEQLLEVIQYCLKAHLHLVLVLPPLTAHNEQEIRKLLPLLPTDAEVVVNDWGALSLVQAMANIKPIAGRLLHRVQRSAFIDELQPKDASTSQLAEQERVRSLPEFSDATLRAAFKEMGIGRVTLDNQPLDFDWQMQAPRLHLDIYYPYRYLSLARACDTAAHYDARNGHFPLKSCPKYCEVTAVHLPSDTHKELIQRNNAFYKLALPLELPSFVMGNKRNRLVWEPML